MNKFNAPKMYVPKPSMPKPMPTSRIDGTPHQSTAQRDLYDFAATRQRMHNQEQVGMARAATDLQRRRDNPVTLVDYGTTLTDPLQGAYTKYDGLGSSCRLFYLFVILRNNLYNYEDQVLSCSMVMTMPTGSQESSSYPNWNISKDDPVIKYVARWSRPAPQQVPTGYYYYTIYLNGTEAAQGRFNIPA